MAAKRSLLLTIVALIFLVWGGLAVIGIFISRAWDPNSHVWHPSDLSWAVEYVGVEPTLEEMRLNDARHIAQMRYEVPIWATSSAWSVVTLVAALGLLWRRDWARWLFIGLVACAALGVVWLTLLFRSLRMTGTLDTVTCFVLVVALGSIVRMLLSPSIAMEFRNERSQL
jgi:hypothetical protein